MMETDSRNGNHYFWKKNTQTVRFSWLFGNVVTKRCLNFSKTENLFKNQNLLKIPTLFFFFLHVCCFWGGNNFDILPSLWNQFQNDSKFWIFCFLDCDSHVAIGPVFSSVGGELWRNWLNADLLTIGNDQRFDEWRGGGIGIWYHSRKYVSFGPPSRTECVEGDGRIA